MNNQAGNYNQKFNQNYSNMNNSNSNNKNETRLKIIISILGLAILVVAIIGISFAAYKNIIVTNNPSTLSTGKITVSFTEDNNSINLKNALPVSDKTGKEMNENSFDFAVTTTASKTKIPYTISITTDKENTLDSSYIKLYLLKDGKEVVTPRLISSLPIYKNRDDSKVLYKIEDIFGEKEETKTTHYTLKAWVDSNFEVNENNIKTFKFKVNVDSSLVGE